MIPSRFFNVFTVLALASLAACQKPPLPPLSNPHAAREQEDRLTRIESQLNRVEESLRHLAEAEAAKAKQPEPETSPSPATAPADTRVSVYVYGEGVPKPGEQRIPAEGTVLMAVAAAGGSGYATKKLDVIRKDHDAIELNGMDEWKNFTLEEGDVIRMKPSAY